MHRGSQLRLFLAHLAGLLLAAAPTAFSQVAYDSPQGRVVVLGLRHWTLAMLKDSVSKYAPGQQLHEAACMVVLREQLHFPEADVARFLVNPPGQPDRVVLTIKLVEPDQAARIQWDKGPRNEFAALIPDFAPLALAMTDSTGTIRRGRILYWLQLPDGAIRQDAMSRASEPARADGARIASFLSSQRSEAARVRAMRTLAADGFWVNRMLAAATLTNFPAADSTWWSLVRALRDPHQAVRETADMVLRALPSRHVEWRNASSDLRLLLGGTNLPAMQSVFDLLARTEVSPALASSLLRDNADWLLEHLGAETPMASESAHRLLIQLDGGRDLGSSRGAWEPWIRSLSSPDGAAY